jgi:hypothetical protein
MGGKYGHVLWPQDATTQHVRGEFHVPGLVICQNSYIKLPFVVDLPIKDGDFP